MRRSKREQAHWAAGESWCCRDMSHDRRASLPPARLVHKHRAPHSPKPGHKPPPALELGHATLCTPVWRLDGHGGAVTSSDIQEHPGRCRGLTGSRCSATPLKGGPSTSEPLEGLCSTGTVTEVRWVRFTRRAAVPPSCRRCRRRCRRRPPPPCASLPSAIPAATGSLTSARGSSSHGSLGGGRDHQCHRWVLAFVVKRCRRTAGLALPSATDVTDAHAHCLRALPLLCLLLQDQS